MKKGMFTLLAPLALACFAATYASAQGVDQATAVHPHIKSVTAITEVFSDGQKLTAAAVEYDRDIRNASVAMNEYTVDGRTITRVYANAKADKAAQGVNGRFVILELSPSDPDAFTFSQRAPGQGGAGGRPPGQGPGGSGGAGTPGGAAQAPGGPPNSAGATGGPGGPGGPRQGGPRNMSNGQKRVPAKVTVTQSGEILTASGTKYPADPAPVLNSKVVNLVVDDFVQRSYTDPASGEVVPYNLFIPKNYDKAKKYPIIIFIHDAGVLSTQTDTTLVQGIGATIWATASEQAKHPSFVLAPQFNHTPEGGGSLTDVTVDLLKSVVAQYSIDSKRIYTTGQSLGCTLSMEMMIKYPDLFAGAMLVAGQVTDTARTAALAHQHIWMQVSEGDFQAFPTMNKSLPIIESAGAKIDRDRWSARLAGPELAAKDNAMLAQNANFMYVTFEKGTTFPPGMENSTGTEHMGTWKFAYENAGIRDWLYRQSK